MSEHKHREQALRASQERYAQIIDSAMDAIISIDVNQRILLFNAAAETMFGCTADQVIGKSLERFIPEPFRNAHDKQTRAFGRTGVTNRKMGFLGTIKGLRANGEEFPIEASISQCGSGDEKVFTAILRDRTEFERGEFELHARLKLQDQFVKVAASVPGVICSFRLRSDGSACMPYASPAIESFFGINGSVLAEDFSPVFARTHPDDIGHINDTIAQSALTLQPWRDSFRYNHPNKGEIWIEGHSMPLREVDGSILWHGYIQDVTERKLAEKKLQNQEKELRLIMDATPALIAYLNTDFQYCRVNATYQNWFCIDPETILGLDVKKVTGDKAWPIIRPYLERARAGECVHFDQQIPYGTDQPRWVHGSYIPDKDANGNVQGIVVHIFDIDERVHMEESLRASQQENKFLADLIRNSSQPVAVGYPNGRLGLVNLAFEALTGYSAEELQRIEWTTVLTPPEWLEFERNKLAELHSMDFPIRYQKEYLRKNGTRVPIELLVHLVTDADGNPAYYYAFITDITERNQAADSLRANEAFVREVLDSLPEHVVVLDNNGVVIAVNEPWERFAMDNGGSPITLSMGANYLDVCRKSSAAGDSDARKALAGLETILAGQQQEFVMEYPCPTAKGELWFIMHAKRLVDSLKGVIITHIDITEHRRAELALLDTQARLALVVGEVKAGYWDWDLLSNTLYLSPEWKQQIGFDEHELANQRETWESRLHPDDRAMVLTATENYIAGIQPVYELDFRIRHKDGSYRWIHARAVLLRDQNYQPYRMLGLNLDITNYKNTQELSERRELMEQTFRQYVARQTAAAIAHELNQPLTAIYSYSDVALHLLQNGNRNPQKLYHVLENCALQALRAGEVIRQLLQLLQKGETLSEPINVNNLVHESLDLIKADGFPKAYSIGLNLAADLPLVLSNQLHFQKVLVNLIRNGLESMQESGLTTGSLTISTRRYASGSTMVEVIVRDCGKGLKDSTDLKKMFQHFYTTKPSGLGMGLAISRTLIETHGGKMWAEQNTDIGLSIHFTLPIVY